MLALPLQPSPCCCIIQNNWDVVSRPYLSLNAMIRATHPLTGLNKWPVGLLAGRKNFNTAPWQILFKIDVLQATQEFGGTWVDQRETAFLGAIRADVIRWT